MSEILLSWARNIGFLLNLLLVSYPMKKKFWVRSQVGKQSTNRELGELQPGTHLGISALDLDLEGQLESLQLPTPIS